MRLSAPIFRLKRQAKLLARETGIPLNTALDRLAKDEGFSSWSLLAAQDKDHGPATKVFAQLRPGDMVLVAARPGHGKTLLGLQLIAQAIRAGSRGVFYTLESTVSEVADQFRSVGIEPATLGNAVTVDTSEAICADYIIHDLREARPGTVVVIDYLQLLDQKRKNPELAVQIAALRAFVDKAEVIVVLISQIDRSYDAAKKALPTMSDVRLPNPVKLSLFTKSCFLNDGEIRLESVA
jgi:KaiC